MSKHKCYVYCYYLDDQIVYVGKGTGSTSFSRAKQLASHGEFSSRHHDKFDNVEIRIVSEDLSHESALAVEGLLIRTLKPLGSLTNRTDGKESRILSRELTKSGVRRIAKARDPEERREASRRGGRTNRKYSEELGRKINIARAAVRLARTQKTLERQQKTLRDLLILADFERLV